MPLSWNEIKTRVLNLYESPVNIPPDLVRTHQALDKAVDLYCRPQALGRELVRIEFLFELYEANALRNVWRRR